MNRSSGIPKKIAKWIYVHEVNSPPHALRRGGKQKRSRWNTKCPSPKFLRMSSRHGETCEACSHNAKHPCDDQKHHNERQLRQFRTERIRIVRRVIGPKKRNGRKENKNDQIETKGKDWDKKGCLLQLFEKGSRDTLRPKKLFDFEPLTLR
jgi:hypothetical protein